MENKPYNANFDDVKEKILAKLNELDMQKKLGLTEKVSLVEGIINQPLNTKVTGNVVVGGPVVPTIALVGVETGRLYFFALRALLGEEDK